MPKILIIEDEKVLAEMYKDKFEKEEFEVYLAFTSDEGLNLAKKEKPDLILLDILLPGKDGISFLKWLKNESEISSIPVVVISNYDDPRAKKEALDLGIKEYLLKTDYTPQQLVEKIKKYL
jgi:DNA-binding response OmpR family regulator